MIVETSDQEFGSGVPLSFLIFLLVKLKVVVKTKLKKNGKLLYFPSSSNSSNWVAQYENISVLFIGIIECLADHDRPTSPTSWEKSQILPFLLERHL
jgi:hypothetical protein